MLSLKWSFSNINYLHFVNYIVVYDFFFFNSFCNVKSGKIFLFYYFFRSIRLWFEGVCILVKKKRLRSLNSFAMLKGYANNILVKFKFLIYPNFFIMKQTYGTLTILKKKRQSKVFFLKFKFKSKPFKRKDMKIKKFFKTVDIPDGYVVVKKKKFTLRRNL